MQKFLQKSIESYLEGKSKAYSEIYMLFLEFWTFYFKQQGKRYIESLDSMPELKKTGEKSEFIDEINALLAEAYLLGQTEELVRIENNLASYGYKMPENMVISSEKAKEYAEDHSAELIKWIDETTKKEISTIVSMGIMGGQTKFQIAEKIKETFECFSLYRANLITHMEMATAYSTASRQINDNLTDKLGVTGWKRALTQKDDNVRTSHKENEKVGWIPKNQDYPYATLNPMPPFDFNCRCSESYSAVNPNTGKLYDNPLADEESTENKIKNFENSLKILAEQWNIDISTLRFWKNNHLNVLNLLQIVNKNFPGKKDGKNSKLKTNIYNIKNHIILHYVSLIKKKELKWKYKYYFHESAQMWWVTFFIWKMTKKLHTNQETIEKIKELK